jgi:hypothetical protein
MIIAAYFAFLKMTVSNINLFRVLLLSTKKHVLLAIKIADGCPLLFTFVLLLLGYYLFVTLNKPLESSLRLH